jgi:hypothetical protein
VLNAFIDDSASAEPGRKLVLAGYVHRATRWMKFSDAWQVLLDEEPSIKYFKMSEAESRKGQFLGWEDGKVLKKLYRLAGLIERYKPWSIACSVSVDDYEEIFKPIAPYDFRYPYFPCFTAIVIGAARVHLGMGLSDPVDFVFDDQGEIGEEALLWFEMIMESQSPEIKSLVPNKPIFRNDQQILPLQAADFLAWHLRRSKEPRNMNEKRPIMKKLIPLQHAELDLSRDQLKLMADDFCCRSQRRACAGQKRLIETADEEARVEGVI